jgi:hypothetical protein
MSVNAGQTENFKISTPSTSYHIDILRVGYYQGNGARKVVSNMLPTASLPQTQSACLNGATGTGLIDCGNWAVSASWAVPSTAVSGLYIAHLVRNDTGGSSLIPFVVRNDASHSDILYQTSDETWQAYNTYGGNSLYVGSPAGRAYKVSYNRPFTTRGTGAEDFVFNAEYPMVRWLEANGYDVKYWAGVDTDRRGSELIGTNRPRLFVSSGHDEYWSAGQRDAIEAHVRRGGNYASFSGNTMFWQVRLEDDRRTMVCHKYRAHLNDPVMGTDAQTTMTGMWADPVVGRPETGLLGAGSAWGLYNRFGAATPRGSGAFTVYRDDHWMFAGTGLRYGDLLGADHGVVGYETAGCRLTLDERQLPVAAGGDGTPADIEVVAFTPSSNLAYGEYPASIAALEDQGDLEFIADRIHGGLNADSIARVRHGNAVMVVCRPYPGGGEVVTVGTTDWVFGLAEDPAVGTVTRNVIERLAPSS